MLAFIVEVAPPSSQSGLQFLRSVSAIGLPPSRASGSSAAGTGSITVGRVTVSIGVGMVASCRSRLGGLPVTVSIGVGMVASCLPELVFVFLYKLPRRNGVAAPNGVPTSRLTKRSPHPSLQNAGCDVMDYVYGPATLRSRVTRAHLSVSPTRRVLARNTSFKGLRPGKAGG
jgi:hypothetical protein